MQTHNNDDTNLHHLLQNIDQKLEAKKQKLQNDEKFQIKQRQTREALINNLRWIINEVKKLGIESEDLTLWNLQAKTDSILYTAVARNNSILSKFPNIYEKLK